MKRYLKSVLLLLFIGLCCTPEKGTPSNTKKFYAANFETEIYDVITSDLIYNGTHCIVYKDINENTMSIATIEAIGLEFDNNIYNKITNSFGQPSDVDSNGKVVILLLDIKDGSTGGSYTAGFFDPTNEYSKKTYAASNECEMLYIDSKEGSAYLSSLKETMAHEYQHLISYNQKKFVQKTSGFDTWINEGMSSAAEKIYAAAQITDKISHFNSDIDGMIAQGTYFISWDSIYTNYTTVYVFFQWLSINASNGDDVYKTIMDQPYTDYRAVLETAKIKFSGYNTIAFSGTWNDLYRNWLVATALANLSPYNKATYPYIINGNSTPEFYPVYTPSSSGSYPLKPGEAIFINTSGSHIALSNSGYLQYAGIDTSTGAVNTTDAAFTGNILVAYNSNGTENTSIVTTGTLSAIASVQTSTAQSALSASMARSATAPRINKPVDMLPQPGEFKLNEIIPSEDETQE